MKNQTVFSLLGKERTLDAKLTSLCATTEYDINRIYTICEELVEAGEELDLMLYVYVGGRLAEISIFDENELDFKVITQFE